MDPENGFKEGEGGEVLVEKPSILDGANNDIDGGGDMGIRPSLEDGNARDSAIKSRDRVTVPPDQARDIRETLARERAAKRHRGKEVVGDVVDGVLLGVRSDLVVNPPSRWTDTRDPSWEGDDTDGPWISTGHRTVPPGYLNPLSARKDVQVLDQTEDSSFVESFMNRLNSEMLSVIQGSLGLAIENFRYLRECLDENDYDRASNLINTLQKFFENFSSYAQKVLYRNVKGTNKTERLLLVRIKYVLHDMNNSLTVLMGYLSCLAIEVEKREEGKIGDTVDVLEEQCQVFSKKLERFFSPENLIMRHVRVDGVAAYLPDVNPVLKRLMKVDRIVMEGSSVDKGMTICVDLDTLNDILIELLNNSLDAMPEGNGKIIIKYFRDGDFCRIEFSDEGYGIPPEKQPFIFEPRVTSKAQGGGIGLAKVRDLVKRAGGEVGVESTPGEGTTILLWIPLVEES